MSNKLDEKLGFFVFTLQENDPYMARFMIKYKNKLDIGDTDIYVMRMPMHGVKELIISYKTIYINTYNVIVMDITD